MVGMAIVAIPSKDSYVWKLSSEKIPHLTILYLGDQQANPDLELIIQQVKHAAENTLTRFGMTVDRRGELGDDRADVLFFEKNPGGFGAVNAFRTNLLKYDAIKKAYDAVEQFPQWTPHLTLGYPERPAKPDTREYPHIHHVEFDKIMVWTDEFDGPEFILKSPDNVVSEVAMSQISTETSEKVEEFLAHYGVKGMRWGVRRDLKKLRPGDRADYIARKDSKWTAKVEANPKVAKISKMASKDAKRQIKQLNTQYAKKDLKKDALTRSRYDSEIQSILTQSLAKASNKVHGMSPTRLSEVKVYRFSDGSMLAGIGSRNNVKLTAQRAKITKADEKRAKRDARAESKAAKAEVKHADLESLSEEDAADVIFAFTLDSNGFATDVITPFDDLEHSEELDDFLAHYGVKGMRWGVRRSDDELARARGKSEGGESRTRRIVNRVTGKKKSGASSKSDDDGDETEKKDSPRLSADAERFVATTQKTSAEMSTREIKEAVQRANMVKQYNELLGGSPNSQLKQQVEALRLRKEYGQLKSELDPPAIERVKSLVSSAKAPYDAYKKLPDPLREEINGLVAEAFGRKSKYTPRHRK